MTATLTADHDTRSRVLRITGSDRHSFLQGLVSNDVSGPKDGLVYAALLSPQGKYLADFFLQTGQNDILLDVDDALAGDLAKRLAMYKLRADVQIAPTDLIVLRGTGPVPQGALPDPRNPALGWRLITTPDTAFSSEGRDWDSLYVAHMIPQSGVDLIANDSYILEMGFERLAGVDFKKGCYVGQEVTARMKHKTELRKGLGRITLSQPVPSGTKITRNGKDIGHVGSVAGTSALAYLRFDRIGPGAVAGPADVTFPD